MVARMLRCGKYQGLLFAEVAALDKPYCSWALDLPASTNAYQKFSTYLRMNHGGLLRVGKHKGKYFNEVLQDDPQYAEWVASLGDPTASLGEFAEYCRRENWLKDDFSVTTTPLIIERTPLNEDFVCKICLVTPVKTVLLPCAHMTCASCAMEIGDNACPFCRKRIRKKVRTYMS